MKLTKVFTSFLIILLNFTMFNTAYANTVGGWTLSNPVAQGASTLYSGLKNVLVNGKNVAVTGSALITPAAVDVAKLLGKGVAGVALSFAVEQLLGSVDWVLDPANNRIKYYEEIDSGDRGLAACQRFYPTANRVEYQQNTTTFFTLCYFNNSWLGNLTSPINQDKEEKYLPLDVVAQQVISNANAGDTNAQVATTAAAADIVAEAETDNTKARPIIFQLENTATYPSETTAETKTDTKTNEDGTTTQESTTDLPAACAWMPSVCEFASNAINFMSSDSVDSDSVETPERELDSKSFNPNMYASSSQCPADKTLSMNIVGRSYSKTFSFSDICRELSSLSNLVMAAAYAYGAIIISRDA